MSIYQITGGFAGRNKKILLKKEELDITKYKVQTGEVLVRKELKTENKTINVPVTREELVITKKVYPKDNPAETKVVTLRIPIKTERVEITKHPVILENVDIHKKTLEKIQQIRETVKKEKAIVETTDDRKIKIRNIKKYRISKSRLSAHSKYFH